MSNLYCLPGRGGGSPGYARRAKMGNHGEQKDAKTRYLPLPTVLQEYRTVSTDRQIEVMGAAIGCAHDRGTQSAAGRWGILFQQGALFSSLTVRQNIQFPLRENLVLSDVLMDEIATAKLEMVGLAPEDGDKFPSELSGGMTKRVALARALALDPAIVFLDEPTSGLDPI